MKDLHKDPDAVERAIAAIAAKSGRFKLRDHASGTLKPTQLYRLLEQYRAEGIIFDLVIVDYADIMAAEYRSDSLQENLRTIYVDLRAIAYEANCALLTATQTNRDGAKAATAKATDVGDDWNKARTVDIMIGINATDAEKAANEARLTWLLARNGESGFSLRIKQDRAKMQFLTKVIGKE
jgi:replicative DNA helicase